VAGANKPALVTMTTTLPSIMLSQIWASAIPIFRPSLTFGLYRNAGVSFSERGITLKNKLLPRVLPRSFPK